MRIKTKVQICQISCFSPVYAAALISPSVPVFVRNKYLRGQGRINLGAGGS